MFLRLLHGSCFDYSYHYITAFWSFSAQLICYTFLLWQGISLHDRVTYFDNFLYFQHSIEKRIFCHFEGDFDQRLRRGNFHRSYHHFSFWNITSLKWYVFLRFKLVEFVLQVSHVWLIFQSFPILDSKYLFRI